MNKFQISVLSVLLLVCGSGFASPPPGTYDLYDGSGNKTGRVFSAVVPSTYEGKPTTMVETTTRLNPETLSHYLFTEKDTAHRGPDGLVTFRRETDDNGKKSTITGERRGNLLYLFIEKEGKKASAVVPFSSFDLTEFEMDLPDSKFTSLKKKGETTSLRVFMVELLKPMLISRNIVDVMTAPFNGKEVPVLITSTLTSGKATTSWFHAKTHKLLQEEGPNHLMSRVSE